MTPGRLCLLFLGLVVYGSFYPFGLDLARFQHVMAGPVASWIPRGRTSIGDMLQNILAYIPLGLFLRHTLAHRRGASLWTVVLCCLLSVSIEILQNATRSRHPNLVDVALNTLGSSVGVAIAIMVPADKMFHGAARIQPMMFLLGLTWIGLEAAPFVPAIGFYKLRMAIAPALAMQWSLQSTLTWAGCWIVLAALIRRSAARGPFWLVFGTAVGFSLLCQVTITGRQLTLDRMLGLVLALPFAVVSLPGLSALAAIAAVTGAGLYPYQFHAGAGVFGWIPFAGFLAGDWLQSYTVALQKAFLYGGCVWLLRETGFRPWVGGLGLAVLLAAIEAAQMYLPGRTAEIADPLIALLAILVVEGRSSETNGHRRRRTSGRGRKQQ